MINIPVKKKETKQKQKLLTSVAVKASTVPSPQCWHADRVLTWLACQRIHFKWSSTENAKAAIAKNWTEWAGCEVRASEKQEVVFTPPLLVNGIETRARVRVRFLIEVPPSHRKGRVRWPSAPGHHQAAKSLWDEEGLTSTAAVADRSHCWCWVLGFGVWG